MACFRSRRVALVPPPPHPHLSHPRAPVGPPGWLVQHSTHPTSCSTCRLLMLFRLAPLEPVLRLVSPVQFFWGIVASPPACFLSPPCFACQVHVVPLSHLTFFRALSFLRAPTPTHHLLLVPRVKSIHDCLGHRQASPVLGLRVEQEEEGLTDSSGGH